jgi:hypothetical protein
VSDYREVHEQARQLKCDRCGKFTRYLHAVPSNPPEGGFSHEVCCSCRHFGEAH